MNIQDIDYALVEETRPPIYTAMKYWGKKPHNIWHEYIHNYAPESGLVMDPFAGSCVGAFEAVKAGRKALAFDLNPLSTFLIEVLSSDYIHETFSAAVDAIFDKIASDSTYKNLFSSVCPECQESAILQNTKRDNGEIYEVGVYCYNHGDDVKKTLKSPDSVDLQNDKTAETLAISFWVPSEEFPSSPSFNASFIRNVGGNQFKNIWTKRNLYVIAFIFDEILKITNKDLQRQLMFGFTQTIHLCTKMSIPRRSNANRPFSTSWGRSAYVCSSRQMEMNPLLVFRGAV